MEVDCGSTGQAEKPEPGPIYFGSLIGGGHVTYPRGLPCARGFFEHKSQVNIVCIIKAQNGFAGTVLVLPVVVVSLVFSIPSSV